MLTILHIADVCFLFLTQKRTLSCGCGLELRYRRPAVEDVLVADRHVFSALLLVTTQLWETWQLIVAV